MKKCTLTLPPSICKFMIDYLKLLLSDDTNVGLCGKIRNVGTALDYLFPDERLTGLLNKNTFYFCPTKAVLTKLPANGVVTKVYIFPYHEKKSDTFRFRNFVRIHQFLRDL